jgi:hypothetical protein
VENCRVARASGYNLDKYLSAWRAKDPEKKGEIAPKAADASAARVTDLPETDLQADAPEKQETGVKGRR